MCEPKATFVLLICTSSNCLDTATLNPEQDAVACPPFKLFPWSPAPTQHITSLYVLLVVWLREVWS